MPNSTISADWRDEKIVDERRVGKFPADDDPRQIAAIERALDLLLPALLDALADPPNCPDWVNRLQDDLRGRDRKSGAGFVSNPRSFLTYETDSWPGLIGENPIVVGLKHSIHELGERLYALLRYDDDLQSLSLIPG
jgi:hypothetical protein